MEPMTRATLKFSALSRKLSQRPINAVTTQIKSGRVSLSLLKLCVSNNTTHRRILILQKLLGIPKFRDRMVERPSPTHQRCHLWLEVLARPRTGFIHRTTRSVVFRAEKAVHI